MKSLTVCSQMGVSYSTPYPLPPSLTPSTGLALTPRSLARHRPDSYVEQWTASVQQALPSQTALTITYLGGAWSSPVPPRLHQSDRPNHQYAPLPRYPSEIDTKYNQGASNFNALVTSVNRRFQGGLFLAGNYMYSHALERRIGRGRRR
jgi:hypothetical protein